MINRRGFLSSSALVAGAAGLAMSGTRALAHPYEEISLWPGSPPGRGGPTGPEKIGTEGAGYGAVSNISTPRMRVYRPNHPNGMAVMI